MASSSSADNLNQDHYGVLGIERRASQDDVRSAYRLRSHMFHPDKYENYPEPLRTQLLAEAAKEFKKLTTAYDTLRDPQKRATYDRQAAYGWSRPSPAPRAAARPAAPRTTKTSSKRATSAAPGATVRDAAEADAEEQKQAEREAARRAQREERARRAAEAAARPRERDPMLVVRPDSLDFGAMALGASKQLPVKIANAGGRTLFGEVSSNRAWLSVNRRSFVSSSVLVLVSVDTNGLRAGEEYTGALAVTTLNGGDQVVPVSVRVSGKPEPLLAGVPSLLAFGSARGGGRQTRTIRLTNAGTGTLIGSVATRVSGGATADASADERDIHAVEWLTVSESRFLANDFSFEVTAATAGMLPGDHEGEVLVLTNGGQARVKVLLNVTAGPGAMTRGARTNGAASPKTSPESAANDDSSGANPAVADLSKDERTQLL